MTAGKFLKGIIDSKGLKQSHIAETVGMSPQIFGQILAEKRKIEVSEFYKICVAIGEDPTAVAIRCGIYAPECEATA